MNAPRIVSLIASATEIVCELGFADNLVGCSHECDYPSFVNALPKVTSPKFCTDGTSYEIDQRVKAIVQEGLSVYRVQAEMLEALQPTHVITQSQCQVCAVSFDDVQQALCQIVSSRPSITSLEPNCLQDIFADFLSVGRALSAEKAAQALVDRLTARMTQVHQRAYESNSCPTVVLIEWIEPLMAAGNWMPELVEMANGKSLLAEGNRHSSVITFADLVELNPNVIMILPCGFDIKTTFKEIAVLTNKPEWSGLQAVVSKQVYVVDGNQYFNRPGPRIAESLEILAEILHPDLFDFGFRGMAWQKVIC